MNRKYRKTIIAGNWKMNKTLSETKAFAEEIPGTTKLIIAQRVASIQEADLIVVLDGGKVAATGTHESLLETSDIYREVFESQVKGGEE